jgi:hypothetical protein
MQFFDRDNINRLFTYETNRDAAFQAEMKESHDYRNCLVQPLLT